ncbi:MAG: hypothetical protein K2K74_06880 [Lachnospiraceae bacterium]|nr:hypothetical protein [Lachnospiraceae bacterium]
MFHKIKNKADSIEECQKNQDWTALSKSYYQLGVSAMEAGDLNHAHLWLHRADTIYSADDDIYDAVGEKLMNDCSDRIGQLEEEALLYNDVPSSVEEMAESLGDAQIRVWGLLSLARLVKLGEKLSVLPGCEVLGNLGRAVDTVLKSFQEPPTEEEFNGLKDLCSVLYDLGDSPVFWGMGSAIDVPGGEPLQVFDLNGLLSVLEIEAYLHGHLEFICALSQEEEPPSPETGIISAALLPDYYVRTGAGNLAETPQIKAELERISSDYDFLNSEMTWDLIQQRVEEYKKLDILA